MYSLFVLALSSFCLALVLTPLCRNLFRRWGWVDRPDGQRKLHDHPIPRAGGVPIVMAYLGAFALLLAFPFAAGAFVKTALPTAERVLWATVVVFAVGLLDDLLGLKPWQKFAGQVAAACLLISAGVDITHVGRLGLPAWLGMPITVLWLVGCSNAFNLIDGVDGLAAGAGLFATVTILLAALLQGNVPLALATVPLAGALLGFLRYNFNPASIFLGDSGSLTVGFLLGCCGVVWSQKCSTALGMTAPLIALSIPLLDTGLAIGRRFLRNKPIFGGDRGHIHHKLLARGLTPLRVVVLMYLVCGVCAALSLLQSFAHERFGGAIIIIFCAGALFGIQRLGYAEFEAARRVFLSTNFRRILNAQIQLSTFRDDLAAAATPDQCWEVLQSTYSEFGFNEIRFKFGGRLYSHTTNGHHLARTWTVRVRLSENDYLNLSREFDTVFPPIVARYTDAIGIILGTKTPEMLRIDRAHAELATAKAASPAGPLGVPEQPTEDPESATAAA